MPTRTKTTPQKAQQKIKLDDLSAADRRRLAEELKARDSGTSTEDQIAAAEKRREELNELLDDRDHLKDCPGGRVEAYAQVKPAKPSAGEPARNVTVVRCIECGGATVIDRPYADVMAEVEANSDD